MTKEVCGFDIAWVGICKDEKPCIKHSHLKCSSCGSPATRTCTSVGLIDCTDNLCNNCTHVHHQ